MVCGLSPVEQGAWASWQCPSSWGRGSGNRFFPFSASNSLVLYFSVLPRRWLKRGLEPMHVKCLEPVRAWRPHSRLFHHPWLFHSLRSLEELQWAETLKGQQVVLGIVLDWGAARRGGMDHSGKPIRIFDKRREHAKFEKHAKIAVGCWLVIS